MEKRYDATAYCGIGIYTDPANASGGFPIRLIDGYNTTPAERSGLRDGDILLRVETEQGMVIPRDSYHMSQLIRGRQGSQVTLEVRRRGNAAPETLTLGRDMIISRDFLERPGFRPNVTLEEDSRCELLISQLPPKPQDARLPARG